MKSNDFSSKWNGVSSLKIGLFQSSVQPSASDTNPKLILLTYIDLIDHFQKPVDHPNKPSHEFHETCHSITFYLMKKFMLWY